MALGLLVLAKVLGLFGVLFGMIHRVTGGVLLGLDGLLLTGSIVVALGTMRDRKKEEATHKAILAQMIREGTLKQYLSDLEREKQEPESEQTS